ncbi:uncharacterized protein [Ptychodera flava]|uniref:uncharacterized protein isoform X2 n=1 Tax=Ptychodera flava TaxID=63121 RepID=UPI00396A1D3D
MAKQSDDWYIWEEEVTLETVTLTAETVTLTSEAVDVDDSSFYFVSDKDLMESPNDISPPSKELSEFSSLEEFSTLEELPLSDKEKMADKEEMKIAVPEGPGIREEETPRFSDPDDEQTEESFEIPQVEYSDSQDSDHPAVRGSHVDDNEGAQDSDAGITREGFPELTSDDSDQLMSTSDVSIPMGTGTSSTPTTDTESGDRTAQTVVEMPSQPAVSEAIAEISADFASGNLNVSLSQYPIDDDAVGGVIDTKAKGLEKPPHERLETIEDTEEQAVQGRKSSEGSEISEHPLDDFVEVGDQVDSSADEISQYPLETVEGLDKTLTDKHEPDLIPLPDQEIESIADKPGHVQGQELKTEDDIDLVDDSIAYQQSKAGVSIISDSVAHMGKKPIDSSTPYVASKTETVTKAESPPDPRETEPMDEREDISTDASISPKDELAVPEHATESDSSQHSTDSLVTSETAKKDNSDVQEVQLPLDLTTLQPESKSGSKDFEQEPEQSSSQSIEMRPASFYIEYPSDLQSGQSNNSIEGVEGERNDDSVHVWSGIKDGDIKRRIEKSSKSDEEGVSGESRKQPANSANLSELSEQDPLARRVALLLGEDVGADVRNEQRRDPGVYKEADMEPATKTLIQDIESFIETGEAVGGIILPPESREPIKHSLSTSSHEFIPPPAEFDEPIRQRTISPPSSENSTESSDSISRQVAELLDRTDSIAGIGNTDYQFKRPYSPTGSDSTSTSDAIAQKVDYLLGIAQLQTRDVAEGLDLDLLDQHAASPSTLSEASTSSSVRAIIERVMARHGRPELDFYNGSSFIDTSHVYQLPDRSSPAGSADFEDDLSTQITDAYSLTEHRQPNDLEVQGINERLAVPGEVEVEDEDRDEDTDREGSPDSLTECKTPSTPSRRKTDWTRSSPSPIVSAGFSLHDDVPQDPPQSMHSIRESDLYSEDPIQRRISANISGASAQSSDSLHRRVQVLLANTAYIEKIPPARMSDPETTPRDSDVPDGGYEDREIFYGQLPVSPTQSHSASEKSRPSDQRSGSRRSSASTGRSSPSRPLLERDAHGTPPAAPTTPRHDIQHSEDYDASERDDNWLAQNSVQDQDELFRRTEPEGRSALVGDPVLRKRIAARLLEDSAEASPVREPRQDGSSGTAEVQRSYGELPPIASARVGSGTSFRESTSHHIGSRPGEMTTSQSVPSSNIPSPGDDASSLAERVRKILEKESPVNQADQIIDEAEKTARSSIVSREVQSPATSEYTPVTPFSLRTAVATTDSLPYSPISSTGYRPIGASHLAKNLISQQLQKMSENRFDQSVELRAQVTGIIEKHLDRPSSPEPASKLNQESRERTYYQERQDDSLGPADDAVRRAIHDAWTVRDSPPPQATTMGRSVQYGRLPLEVIPQKGERELPVGDEEKDTFYGMLPPPSLSSTVKTSIHSSQPPPFSSGYPHLGTDREHHVMYAGTGAPTALGQTDKGFIFRKSYEDDQKKEEPVKESDDNGVSLPITLSLAKPSNADQAKEKQFGVEDLPTQADDSKVNSGYPRGRNTPVLRPYRPPGSPDVYQIYIPEQDDNVSPGRSDVNTGRSEVTTGRSEVTTGRSDTTSGREITSGRSETTMESTHSGSDDACGPYLHPSQLGSRKDKPPQHPTGIYGNRTPKSNGEKKKHVWDVTDDTSLMKSRISEKSTETDRASDSLNNSGELETTNASTESLRSKPARSFIEYPRDLRSKTPTEAAEQIKSPSPSFSLPPVQYQSVSRVMADDAQKNARDLVMEEGGPLDIGDLSSRPARSFIEYPSDLKSQSAASLPEGQNISGSPQSRPQSRGMESSKPIPIPTRDSAGMRIARETSLESRERYLHEQPMATSPIRAALSSPVRSPVRFSNSEERRDIPTRVVASSPSRLPPGRSATVTRSPVRAASYSEYGRDRPPPEEVRRVYAMQKPMTTAFEISKPTREEQGRPAGAASTDYGMQAGRIPSRYTATEDPYRRPAIGRDYATLPPNFTPRDYAQMPPPQTYYASVPPSADEYGAFPSQPLPPDYVSMENRNYATLPPQRRPAERSYSQHPEETTWGTTEGDFGKIGDGYTTWPPRGEARHDRRTGQPLPFGASQPGQRFTTQVLQEILEQEDRDAKRLGELWAQFQEMLQSRAEDSSESVMSDRIDRLTSLIQNPVQHTVRHMTDQVRQVESQSDASSVGSPGTPGRRRKKWQRHERFEPKQQSEDIEDTHEPHQVPRYRYQTQANESELTQFSSASTNDSVSTERIMKIIEHTQPVQVQQQQRKSHTETDSRKPAGTKPADKASIDAARIRAILEAEMAPHLADQDTATDTSMASNMSYETERLYKMLGPRGVRHLGVKLARLQRKIDKQRERHERHQAKRVERQKHYDKQRGIDESAASSSTSLSSGQSGISAGRLINQLGQDQIQSSTPQVSALSPVKEADLRSVSATSISTESTITEDVVRRKARPAKAHSRDDFEVKYGYSDVTTDSLSDASCCRVSDRPKRALSLHDIANKREKHHDKARDPQTYHKKPAKTRVTEKKPKKYEYFEIDDEGFKKPNKPAPKKAITQKGIAANVEVAPTKDVGTTFPSPDVKQLKKKRGGTAFTVSLGTQTTPKADKTVKPPTKRQLKVLEPPKVEKSKIYTPETPDADSKGKQVSPVAPPLAWFQPITTKQPWQQEPPRKPLKETQTKSEEPEEKKETLQDALEKKKCEFISKSRERVKRIELAAEERKVSAHYERERLKLFDEKHGKKSNPQAHPYSDQLHHPKRRQMSQKEMKKQTEKIYKKLPEVVRKKEEQKKQQAHKTNRLRAQIYKQKILNQIKGKPWPGMV